MPYLNDYQILNIVSFNENTQFGRQVLVPC